MCSADEARPNGHPAGQVVVPPRNDVQGGCVSFGMTFAVRLCEKAIQ